jgi:hypothetical protein
VWWDSNGDADDVQMENLDSFSRRCDPDSNKRKTMLRPRMLLMSGHAVAAALDYLAII